MQKADPDARPNIVFVQPFEPARLEKLLNYFGNKGVHVTPSQVINGAVDFGYWLGEAFNELCIED